MINIIITYTLIKIYGSEFTVELPLSKPTWVRHVKTHLDIEYVWIRNVT